MNNSTLYQSQIDKNIPINQLFISHITIYSSGFILALYLTLLEIMFMGIGLLTRFPLNFLFDSIGPAIYSLDTFIGIVLILVKLLLMVVVITQWLNNYYELYPGRIVYKTGVLYRNEQVFDATQISGANLSQGVLGKLFNFGTITLFVARGDKHIFLPDIPNPHRNLHMIQKMLENNYLDIRMTDSYLTQET